MTGGTSMGLRVVTANVNGIRATARRGGLQWLARTRADALCVQEVRATRAQVEEALADSPLSSWHVALSEAPEKGRAGVAVLTQLVVLGLQRVALFSRLEWPA